MGTNGLIYLVSNTKKSNPFLANVLILYPLVFSVVRGYKMKALARNELINTFFKNYLDCKTNYLSYKLLFFCLNKVEILVNRVIFNGCEVECFRSANGN